jgi:hypothetical protein
VSAVLAFIVGTAATLVLGTPTLFLPPPPGPTESGNTHTLFNPSAHIDTHQIEVRP